MLPRGMLAFSHARKTKVTALRVWEALKPEFVTVWPSLFIYCGSCHEGAGLCSAFPPVYAEPSLFSKVLLLSCLFI